MKLTCKQKTELLNRMCISAEKGNLANAGMVLEDQRVIAVAESWVVSSCDATAHSERMLVSTVCNLKNSNYTPGLTMITVVEPCLMCISACFQAGYKEIGYIIPAEKYIETVPWMSDVSGVKKVDIVSNMNNKIHLVHMNQYENEFCKSFEKCMSGNF